MNKLIYKDLSEKTGYSDKHICHIVKGYQSIRPKFAVNLEKVFGLGAIVWLTMQAEWDVDQLK